MTFALGKDLFQTLIQIVNSQLVGTSCYHYDFFLALSFIFPVVTACVSPFCLLLASLSFVLSLA